MPVLTYNGFDVVTIDTAGVAAPVASTTLNIVDVATLTSLGTATTDAFGHLPTGTVSNVVLSDGSIIRFSSGSYPNTFLRTVKPTEEEAWSLRANYYSRFIIEDNSIESEAVAADVWLRDTDNPNSKDVRLGYAPVGTVTSFKYETLATARHLKVFTNPVTANLEYKYLNYEDAPSATHTAASSLALDVTDLPTMTSAELAAKISDETGTGKLVFATSPVLVAPILGTPNSGNLINCTGFPAAALSGMASWMPSFLTTPLVTDVRARSFTAAGVTNPGNTYFYSYSFENSAGIVSAANFSVNNMNAANAGTYGVFGEARQAVDRSGGAGNIYGGKFTAVVAGNLETAYGLWGRLSVDPGKTATEAGAVLFGTTINGTITTFSGLKQELVNAGTVTNFYGTFTRIQNNASSTITTANALRISSLNNGNTITTFKGIAFEGYGGSGTITNNYLIYADTSPASYGSTNKYGIYFLCDMPSYHVGKFGIGSGVTAPSARLQVRDTSAPQTRIEYNSGSYFDIAVSGAGAVTLAATGSAPTFSFSNTVTFFDSITMANAKDIVLNTSTGTKIGTSTTQKLGFWNTTPIVQPTTGVGAATRSAGVATAILTDDTFDGYTVHQVVKALRNVGLLA